VLLNYQGKSRDVMTLAHELGHVVKRHVAQGMAMQFGLEMLSGIALGNNPSALAQIGAAVAQNGYLLKYSRADEAEADRVGMETILESHYWNPRGLISMMETFRKNEGDPGFLAFLQSHPSPADRIENLTRQWQSAGSPGGEDGVAPFAAIQARLPRRERPRSISDLSR
jgi:predicted Zn-dependent protease